MATNALVQQILDAATPAAKTLLTEVVTQVIAKGDDWLTGFAKLMAANSDAAQQQLLGLMTEAQLVAEVQGAGAENDALVAAGDAAAAERAKIWAEVVNVLKVVLPILAGAITLL